MQPDLSPPAQDPRPSKEREIVQKYGEEMPILLYRWRWQERLTQAEIAEREGCAESTVSSWYSKYKVHRWMPPPAGVKV
jgi:hypothetical protein